MNIDRSGNLSLAEIKYVAAEASDLRLEPGDVVFNNTNSRHHVGKSAIFDIMDAEWGFSNHITRIRFREGLLPKFAAFQLLHLWETGYFRFHAKQHVNQASISTHTLTTEVPLLIAPISDQQQVLDQIEQRWSALDSVGKAIGRAMERLSRYVDRTIIDAASGRLVESEHEIARRERRPYIAGTELLERIRQRTAEEAGALSTPRSRRTYKRVATENQEQDATSLPPGWALARVDEVGLVTLGRKREPASHFGPHMRPYLRVANVLENRIDVSDVLEMNFSPEEYETYRLEYGDILLNEGQSPELVGRPAMYRNDLPGSCFQMTLLRFRAYAGVSATFALVVFRAYLRLGRFRDAARWTTNIAHLSTHRFASMPFPLPPLEEQERIVEEANRRLAAAEHMTDILTKIEQQVRTARHLALRAIFPGTAVSGVALPPDSSGPEANNETGGENAAMTRGRRRAGGRSSVRVPIRTILTNASSGRMRPEELFDASGYTEELVDEFYAELKRGVVDGHIYEVRDSDGESQLVSAEVADET